MADKRRLAQLVSGFWANKGTREHEFPLPPGDTPSRSSIDSYTERVRLAKSSIELRRANKALSQVVAGYILRDDCYAALSVVHSTALANLEFVRQGYHMGYSRPSEFLIDDSASAAIEAVAGVAIDENRHALAKIGLARNKYDSVAAIQAYARYVRKALVLAKKFLPYNDGPRVLDEQLYAIEGRPGEKKRIIFQKLQTPDSKQYLLPYAVPSARRLDHHWWL